MRAGLVALTVLILLSTLPPGLVPVPSAGNDGLTVRAPIIIVGQEGLTRDNGVVRGSGTPEDPYVIEGWRITAPNGLRAPGTVTGWVDSAIYLEQVHGTIVIRDLHIRGPVEEEKESEFHFPYIGIHIVANGSLHLIVENVTFEYLKAGILIIFYPAHPPDPNNVYIEVRNSTFRHIFTAVRTMEPVDGVIIQSNTFYSVSRVAILYANPYCKVRPIIIEDNRVVFPKTIPMSMSFSIAWPSSRDTVYRSLMRGCERVNQEVLIRNNTIVGFSGERLIYASNITGTVKLEGNTIAFNRTYPSDYVSSSDRSLIISEGDKNVIIANNTIRGWQSNVIRATGTVNITIRNNTIENISNYHHTGDMPTLNFTVPGVGVNLSAIGGEARIEDNTIRNIESAGIIVAGTNRTIIRGNIIENTSTGILATGATSLMVTWNIIASNSIGIKLENMRDAVIWNNSFTGNTMQAVIGNNTTTLTWDRGGRGNYWSDYTGVDSDGDGIGDTPYVVARDNTDRYPLLPRAEVTSYTITSTGQGKARITLSIHITQPPGHWRVEARAGQELVGATTITVARTPATVQASLLVEQRDKYNVTLALNGRPVDRETVEPQATQQPPTHRGGEHEEEHTDTTARPPGEKEWPILDYELAILALVLIAFVGAYYIYKYRPHH